MIFLEKDREYLSSGLAIQIKKYICLSIFLLINILFSIKYISRYSDLYIPLTILLITVLLCVFVYKRYLIKVKVVYVVFLCVFLLLCYVGLSMLIFEKFSVETLNVDRWSVITSFWESFDRNEYVYFAKSNVGNPPGPMPFYFILAYPFYLLGELGYYSLLTLPFFLLLLFYAKIEKYIILLVLILLFFSLFIWWEILCRSNIFLNSSLVLFSIIYFFNSDKLDTRRLVISSIIFGLLISTRSVFSIAYVVVCIFALRSRYISFKQFVLLIFISLISFSSTFLPFIINHNTEFFEMNPFVVQSTFLMPIGYTIFFIVLAIVFGSMCKKCLDVYYYISLNLFLCILTYFIYQVNEVGLIESVFGWTVDISYFIFCIPFSIFYVCKIESCFSKNDSK